MNHRIYSFVFFIVLSSCFGKGEVREDHQECTKTSDCLERESCENNICKPALTKVKRDFGRDSKIPTKDMAADSGNEDLSHDIHSRCTEKANCGDDQYCNEGECNPCKIGVAECPIPDENIFTDAYTKKRKINYIITGDSNRENRFSHMKEYYEAQFSKLNIDIFYNSSSGMRTDTWLDNSRNASFDAAIEAARGDKGKDTIWEFSLGANDLSGRSVAEVQQRCKNAIDQFLSKMPEITIVLVAMPPSSSGPDSGSNLKRKAIYLWLKDQYPKAYYVETNAAMKGIQSADSGESNTFYHDSGHLNQNGARRLVNFIMSKIIPQSLHHLVTLEEYKYNTMPPVDVKIPIADPIVGYFSTSKGNFINYSTARAIPKFVIEPNFQLDIYEQGDFHGVYLYDSQEKYIGKFGTDQYAGKPYRTIFIPTEAHKMAINLTIEKGAEYDAKNDVVKVEYHKGENGLLTVDEINQGLTLPFPKAK